MTGEAETHECFTGKHEECRNDIKGYKGAHVDCTCECHKPKR